MGRLRVGVYSNKREHSMIVFEVKDMTCGHCVGTITKAVKAADQGARVQVDLAAHRVEIEPAQSSAVELGQAIKDAGYTPVVVDPVAAEAGAAVAAPRRGGCCCG